MLRKIMFYAAFSALLVTTLSTPALARKMSRTEDFTVPASGIKAVNFKNIFLTDLTYNGEGDTDTFSVKFVRVVNTDDTDEFEDVLAEFDLDITTSDGKVTVELIHPELVSSGILKRIFKRKEWRVEITVTGPSYVDLTINADFSKVRTNSTTGTFKINSDFSDTNISDHTGRLDANVEFASLRCDKLDGSFDVSSEFGEVDLLLVYLAGSSSASTSFGSIDIRLPEDTGAVFHSNKSFASIKFNTGGSLTYEGHNGSRRVLRGGGPRMDLNADFGSISVRDNVRGKQRTSQRIDEGSGANPMTQGAWQRYKSDGETLTLRVTDTRKESRRRVTTLEFDENESSPFESIDVCETDKGLSLYGINGNFFGRDLSGVQFNPSRLWLPFEDDVETEDVLLGTVNAYALKSTVDTPAGEISSVFHYDIEFRNSPVHTIRYALGTGFVAFDDFKLVAYDSGNKADKSTESPPPKPRFEEGVVRSVKIRGARLLKSSEVKELLVIREGTSYTRDEISEDVRNLNGKHRFISSASYSIDVDGNLDVRVYEVKPYKKEFDFDGSFSRVAGLGLGGTLEITSIIGPISELSGGAQYHWGNEEWTFKALAEKRFFTENQFAIGGTYRLDYESGMDWAIPSVDSYMNALLVGLETKNYFVVEGATGYIAFIKGNIARIKAEYFEEEFTSIKKHTNWSIFNSKHKKGDNLPLTPIDEDRLFGMRYSIDIFHRTSFINTGLNLEIENNYSNKSDTIKEYTRLFGNLMSSWRLYDNDILKIRFAGGYSEDILPGQKTFRLGGINTLRGFDFESINGRLSYPFLSGGNRMALCNIEYLLGGEDDVGFIVFADAGGVWIKGQPARISDIRRNVGISLAFGGDFFSLGDNKRDFDWKNGHFTDGLRINWAVPVGNERHVSNWTVNFVRAF